MDKLQLADPAMSLGLIKVPKTVNKSIESFVDKALIPYKDERKIYIDIAKYPFTQCETALIKFLRIKKLRSDSKLLVRLAEKRKLTLMMKEPIYDENGLPKLPDGSNRLFTDGEIRGMQLEYEAKEAIRNKIKMKEQKNKLFENIDYKVRKGLPIKTEEIEAYEKQEYRIYRDKLSAKMRGLDKVNGKKDSTKALEGSDLNKYHQIESKPKILPQLYGNKNKEESKYKSKESSEFNKKDFVSSDDSISFEKDSEEYTERKGNRTEHNYKKDDRPHRQFNSSYNNKQFNNHGDRPRAKYQYQKDGEHRYNGQPRENYTQYRKYGDQEYDKDLKDKNFRYRKAEGRKYEERSRNNYPLHRKDMGKDYDNHTQYRKYGDQGNGKGSKDDSFRYRKDEGRKYEEGSRSNYSNYRKDMGKDYDNHTQYLKYGDQGYDKGSKDTSFRYRKDEGRKYEERSRSNYSNYRKDKDQGYDKEASDNSSGYRKDRNRTCEEGSRNSYSQYKNNSTEGYDEKSKDNYSRDRKYGSEDSRRKHAPSRKYESEIFRNRSRANYSQNQKSGDTENQREYRRKYTQYRKDGDVVYEDESGNKYRQFRRGDRKDSQAESLGVNKKEQGLVPNGKARISQQRKGEHKAIEKTSTGKSYVYKSHEFDERENRN